MLIFLYMFRASMCPLSGEITVFVRHFVLVTLYGCLPDMHNSYFPRWWVHSRPKHVDKRNKHTKKNCAPNWPYLQVSRLCRDVWLPVCSLSRWTAVLALYWDLIFRCGCRYGTLTSAVANPSSLFDSFTLSNLPIQLCSYKPSVLSTNYDMNVCVIVYMGGGGAFYLATLAFAALA